MTENEKDQAQVSAEFPVVVLGESVSSAVEPRQRLLQGRVPERWVLYPIYFLVFLSGSMATHFAVDTGEWATTPVIAAWGMVFVWYWFYGIAYRYRRRFFKYSTVTTLVVLTWCLSLISFDRAQPQVISSGAGLSHRPEVPELIWSGGILVVAVSLLAVHVLVLGRGYRAKK